MSNFFLSIGMLVAIFGPLLNVPVALSLYLLVTRPLCRRLLGNHTSLFTLRLSATLSASLLLGAIHFSCYLPGKHDFDQLCREQATPVIHQRVFVDSFYRTHLFPYELSDYLGEGKFSSVEAPDPYRPETLWRYRRKSDGTLDKLKIEVPTVAFGVEKHFEQISASLTLTRKRIYRIDSNQELARAARASYSGGPLHWLLGSYASASCPDVRSATGSRDFDTFYHLERLVLRAQPEAPPSPRD